LGTTEGQTDTDARRNCRFVDAIVAHTCRVLFVVFFLFCFFVSCHGAITSTTSSVTVRTMGTITKGVEFDTIAREWRCKWSADQDKASLAAAQELLNGVLAELKNINGVKNVQRIVCGGCLDFKVITALSAETFGAWSEKAFAPEIDFLAKLQAIDGITQVETQTYTLMPM
jgi:hypothetical protein